MRFPSLTALALVGALALPVSAEAAEGSFTGASNHITTGGVELVKADGGYEIHLKDNFEFDGAPDPRIGLGKDGKFVDGTDFEPLKSNTGAQVYKVPASIDAAEFDTIVLWCRKFSVPLGFAPLN